ncbi:MAG TPA: TonB C-terminal domain-containing protein [Methylotenera sp.]
MMLRQRENPDSFKAGVFSVLVHTLLLGALLISFNWKTTHPISIAQVELWDSVAVEEHKPPPVPEPLPEPMPVEKEVPEPVVAPEEKPEPKVEIAIEKKPVKKEPVKEVPPKPVAKTNDALAKLQEEARQEALKNKSVTKSNTNDALKKLQQESLSEDKATGEQKASAASAGVVDEFKAKIQAKIRSNVNKTLCGNGNPELKFEIGLIPTGELSGSPKLIKSSGNAACDDAVERAIRVSEPLPLPQDASLFSQFRNLKLTFRPNDN